MPFIFVRCKTENYARWKNAFNDAADMRKNGGEINSRVFRSPENKNEIVTLMEWKNLKKAQEFIQSRGLRNCMKKAGIIGKPDIFFLNEMV